MSIHSLKICSQTLKPEPAVCVNTLCVHTPSLVELCNAPCEAHVRDIAFLCREQTDWLKMIAKFRLESTFLVSSPASCSTQGQYWGQMRLLSALCSWVFKASDRDSSASLDSQRCCLVQLLDVYQQIKHKAGKILLSSVTTSLKH